MNYYIPLPVPASIYGMIILFLCLSTGIIKLSDVKDAGKFLIEIMPLMFIPAGVGLIDSWGVLKPLLLPVTVITAASLVLVFGVSGRVAQRVIRHGEKKKAGAEDEWFFAKFGFYGRCNQPCGICRGRVFKAQIQKRCF